MSIKWNRLYTDLLRGSRSTLWGNWALNPLIRPGAVGIIDPASGDFTLVSEALPDVKITNVQQGRRWAISSKDVSRKETKANVSGTVMDPTSGVQVKPDLTLEWTFGKEESIASEFALNGEQRLSDLALIHDQYDWLYAQAEKVGMASNGRIAEGFGVVTSVILADSGVNAGAKSKNAKFSLSGSASGLNALLGENGISGKGGASFISNRDASSVESHTLPAQDGQIATIPLPVAYSFASFGPDRLIIPIWVKKIGSLRMTVDSKASSATTYVTKVSIAYDLAGESRKTEGPVTVSGGLSTNFDIPLGARNLEFSAEFVNVGQNEVLKKQWATPLSQWVGGSRTINLFGIWPGSPSLQVVEED
ncbi:hypothetical protein ACU5P1_00275 [Pseudomonas plecoglossicida]|uniref:Uncharacterized protein n=1 Tax=Pseudomonas plecoglossicida TaxID=70775 RepID=A0AAD0QYM4_PSEDL|nr:hypothetical protein [Pseudomonas plecoglossicida]AXM97263.1 hypothetical protein DVB73_16505 [Pseudomonas plecoglossicida]EPB94623.1 hypothetical protein L321_17202 [Pseudomonas plecoglossicida NB2011]QLB53361.1 hypothetical protein HAV28_00275 [Pseudomonas plecoglossicida]